MGNGETRLLVQGTDPHPPHQCAHVLAAHIMPKVPKLVAHAPHAVKGILQVNLID